MMLNHDERRRLQDIERELEREDPLLAQKMRQAWPRRPPMWPFVTLLVMGALMTVLGTAVLSLYVVVVGLACVVGGIVLLRKRRSCSDQPRSE